MSSTTLSPASARHWYARSSRARSSTSIAIQAAPRFIPAKRPRSCARPRLSTASRFIASGQAPDAAEIAERRRADFDPYHAALRDRDRAPAPQHQRVALFDAHSIRSVDPAPLRGRTAECSISARIRRELRTRTARGGRRRPARERRKPVVDGRFKGGWITRAFGEPDEGVEALQLELACRAYMHEPEPADAGQLANADRRKARSADARDDQARPGTILEALRMRRASRLCTRSDLGSAGNVSPAARPRSDPFRRDQISEDPP